MKFALHWKTCWISGKKLTNSSRLRDVFSPPVRHQSTPRHQGKYFPAHSVYRNNYTYTGGVNEKKNFPSVTALEQMQNHFKGTSSDRLKGSSDEEEIIRHEQTKLLYAAMPSSITATLINAVILVIVLWPVIPQGTLLSWLTALVAVTAMRGVLSAAFHKTSPADVSNKPWAHWFFLGTLAAALVWGSSALLLFAENSIGHQVFLAFVIAGMSAGGTTSLSFQRLPILVFLGLLLLPLCIRFFLLEEPLHLAMGTMTLLFMVILMLSSKTNYANTRQNIALRIQATRREEALRQSESKYRHIFNAAPLGIVHYDPSGKITDFNETFADLMNLPDGQLLNTNLLRDIPSQPLQSAFRQSLQGKNVDIQASAEALNAKKGLDLHLFCAGIESWQGVIHGGVAIVVDISEEKRVERMKNQFISTVSHELRTPLTAIRGALGLLRGDIAGQMPEQARELLDIATRNSLQLQTLINDILDIDKIDSGALRLNLQPVEVRGFLEETLRVTDHYAKQYRIQLHLDTQLDYGLYVQADHGRLLQVMSNLISNACKFSPENSTVEIGARRENEHIHFFVRDHGPGIPPAFQPIMYDRFTQSDSSDQRAANGTGLGLSITRMLVEKHGGKIHFDTGPEGTTFRVILARIQNLG